MLNRKVVPQILERSPFPPAESLQRDTIMDRQQGTISGEGECEIMHVTGYMIEPSRISGCIKKICGSSSYPPAEKRATINRALDGRRHPLAQLIEYPFDAALPGGGPSLKMDDSQ